MKAEIISTGEELRTGTVVDSNSAYIATRLLEIGIRVQRHYCVGDDLEEMAALFKEVGRRADVAIVTGGLGPTEDDLTADAAARSTGEKLVFHETAFVCIERFLTARNLPVSRISRKQAFLPKGAECLMNPAGTAPGFTMSIGRCRFYFLPGVPHEMKRMMHDAVLPALQKMAGGRQTFHRVTTIRTFGCTESRVSERLSGFSQRFPDLRLGLRAIFPEIQVKLYGQSQDNARLERMMENATRWVMEETGDNVFSIDGNSLETEVGRLLIDRNETLALAESCTGGLLASMLTDVPGSSNYFLFSGVTYSNSAKVNVLGVSSSTLEQHGAVHEQTAIEMAAGARRLAGATYGLATSGIAGPGGGTPEKPVGTVCIGLATPRSTRGFRFYFTCESRPMNKRIFAVMTLDLLRRHLLGFPFPLQADRT